VTSIGTDEVRDFGRGTAAAPSQTCGGCGKGRAAILPDGTVTPCPMSRWRAAGNVAASDLRTLLGEPLAAAAAPLGPPGPACVPDSYCNPLCTPGACKPRLG
jgi:hypothetical protein